MQLDKTRIAIRQRTWSDILDLALHVVRNHAPGLLAATAVGAVPMMLLNYLLIGENLVGVDYQIEWPWAYIWLTLLLTFVELPLATAATTLYLGQVLFIEAANPRQIFRDLWASLGQLLLFQVLLRGILTLTVVTWVIPYSLWPYANEIILLERNPLTTKEQGQLSTRRRSAALHSDMSGELFVRSIAASLLALLLVSILVLTTWYLVGMLSGRWDFDWWVFAVALPVAIWIVATYFAVVRFLGYVDLRIRREGWDVDLTLRAERARLLRQVA